MVEVRVSYEETMEFLGERGVSYEETEGGGTSTIRYFNWVHHINHLTHKRNCTCNTKHRLSEG